MAKKFKVKKVKTNKGWIRTWDNPLNSWVKSIDDGKFYRREK